jgi:hypothetical protein
MTRIQLLIFGEYGSSFFNTSLSILMPFIFSEEPCISLKK